jgi:hypothetical protein
MPSLQCTMNRTANQQTDTPTTLAHISLPSSLNRSQSTHGFNSERTRRTYFSASTAALYVDWCVLLAWVLRLLTFPCTHSIWKDDNQLTGFIPSELGELIFLNRLALGTWIGGMSSWHECHACSHFLAPILFEQMIINSRVPFRANSENWLCWPGCVSVRGLVSLVGMIVKLAHISLPFYWIDNNQLTGSIPSELAELTLLNTLQLFDGCW